MASDREASDAAKDRWLQAALEEYRSLREESLQGLRAQQVGVQVGVTLLAALIAVGVRMTDRLAGALLLAIAVPLLAIFLTALWQGELERSVRVGSYLTARERDISNVASLRRRPRSMGWENWLTRNPHLLLIRYYDAQFFVVGMLSFTSATVGVIGLLGNRRWGLAGLFGVVAVGLLLAGTFLYRNNYIRLMQLRAPAPAGAVAFSFGVRHSASGPSPINLELARMTDELRSSWRSVDVVAAQSEVATNLELRNYERSLIITPSTEGGSMTTTEVWRQAEQFFRQAGITHVIAVAHPFIHLHYVRHLIRRDGYQVVPVHIRRLGFDHSKVNLQWWTRGRLRLVLYGLLLPVLRRHGSARRS